MLSIDMPPTVSECYSACILHTSSYHLLTNDYSVNFSPCITKDYHHKYSCGKQMHIQIWYYSLPSAVPSTRPKKHMMHRSTASPTKGNASLKWHHQNYPISVRHNPNDWPQNQLQHTTLSQRRHGTRSRDSSSYIHLTSLSPTAPSAADGTCCGSSGASSTPATQCGRSAPGSVTPG